MYISLSTKVRSDFLGSITGLLGALLISLNGGPTITGTGFIMFLLSNFCWITYAFKEGAKPLLVMQLGYTITSIIGIVKWFNL